MGPSYFWDQVSDVFLMGTDNREGTGTPQNEHRLSMQQVESGDPQRGGQRWEKWDELLHEEGKV